MGEQKKDIAEREVRRLERHRRRQRNQIIAYTVMLLLIVGLAVGIVALVNRMPGASEETTEVSQDVAQSIVEELMPSDEEPEVLPPVIELTPEQRLDEIVNAAIEVMPIEDKVAGLFIATPESITGVTTAVKAGEGTKAALEKYAVGGVVYRSQNIRDLDQIKEMLENTRLYSKYPIFLGVEQEIGTEGPLIKSGLLEGSTTAKDLTATGDANMAMVAGESMGRALSAIGFNMNLAPLADLVSSDDNLENGYSFGDNVVLNSVFATGYANGMKNLGVTGCLKYFPGSGKVEKIPDTEMLHTTQSMEEFLANDLEMYRQAIAAGAEVIMVGNFSAEAFTGDRTPCTMSELVVTNYLRQELGFQGVIITDFMDQKAITEYYGADEAAIMCLRAGCDMILAPENFETAYNAVLEAVQNGTISADRIDAALRRVYRIKFADRIETEE